MDDLDETNVKHGPGRGRVVMPWVLALGALGGLGYFIFGVHMPLSDEVHKKDATIVELTKLAADARREADAAKGAETQLQKSQEEVKQVREDLARSTAQKVDDEKLLERLKKDVGAGGAEVNGAGGQITVTMVDRILFKSGEADLTPQGQLVLRALGNVLTGTDKLVEVCGHADNLPVESELKDLYPTNWELSTARATNVVRFLQEEVGMKPRRLKAAGFGSFRPIASNATATGRAKNRRIEILLLPDKQKVVKGDFSDEIAAGKTAAGAKTVTAKPKDRDRVKAVVAVRAKRAAKKPGKK